jgi:pimeloyl-ACP methyl ester carboxylesterase
VTPPWFSAALADEPATGTVTVAGAEIAYRAWGEPGADGVLLVHGGAAHSRWWDHVAPQLDGRVVALDLSGHGDSDRRPAYTLAGWADEVHAVIARTGLGERAVVVGHSMGGLVTLLAARSRRLGGAVVLDTPVRPKGDPAGARMRRHFGLSRVYADRAQAVRLFRPVPAQPGEPAVLAHIAEHSLHAVPGGWSWKFDPRVFLRDGLSTDDLTAPHCPVALVRAEHGLVPAPMAAAVAARLGPRASVVAIPGAAHHVMIDAPLALVATLRALLADWRTP